MVSTRSCPFLVPPLCGIGKIKCECVSEIIPRVCHQTAPWRFFSHKHPPILPRLLKMLAHNTKNFSKLGLVFLTKECSYSNGFCFGVGFFITLFFNAL